MNRRITQRANRDRLVLITSIRRGPDNGPRHDLSAHAQLYALTALLRTDHDKEQDS